MKGSDETIDETLQRYVAAAVDHRRESESGDHRAINRAHDELQRAYRSLRGRGAERRLLELLGHPDAGVRLWAATHTLALSSEDAEKTLIALQQDERPLVRTDARMTLELWHKGELKLP
jgi:hypothetical protein